MRKNLRSIKSTLFATAFLLFCFSVQKGSAQENQEDLEVLDKIVAVVGGEIILRSEVKAERSRMMQSGRNPKGNSDCSVLEKAMINKMLLHQAKNDSVVAKESRVERELNRRVRYFTRQFGSRKKLENYYGMSVVQIKEKFRESIREQLRVRKMRNQVTSGINVTPSDVEAYFRNLEKDSVPFIESKVKVAQIVKQPEVSEEQRKRAKKKLQGYRKDILSGKKSFNVIATLYSDDAASAENGGELGWVERGQMTPQFEKVVFDMDSGDVSRVFESKMGYHIAKLIERRGEKVKVKHILKRPKVSDAALTEAKKELDSLAGVIRNDTLNFKEAARLYSDHEATRNNGGVLINQKTGSPEFKMDDLDPQLFFVIDKMKVGEISKPVVWERKRDNSKAYRLVQLVSRSEPHKASLDEDYQFLKKKAQKREKEEKLGAWLTRKLKNTHVRLDKGYRDCDYDHDWHTEEDQVDLKKPE